MSIQSSNDEYDVVFKPNNKIKKIYIELTNDCNLSCEMCYRNSWQVPSGEMNEEVFKLIVDEISSSIAVEEIVLGGLGEAMFHTKFWRFLKIIHKKAPHIAITLTTNGLLLSREDVKKLCQLGITKVIVSVDGADVETQGKVRGQKAESLHDKLVELGREFANNPAIYWCWEIVWQKKNQNQLLPLVKMASECSVSKVFVSHLMPTSRKQLEEVMYNPIVGKSNANYLNAVRNLALRHGIEIILPKNEITTNRYCRFINNQSTVISYKGDIAPCYRYLHGCKEYHQSNREKDVEPYQFGRVTHIQSLLDIWNSSEYLKFRYRIKNNLYPSCHDCELLEGCDIVTRSEWDCDGGEPACGDCLWSRGFIYCP